MAKRRACKKNMEDHRVVEQTPAWKRKWRTLTYRSSDKSWKFIVGHYQGDQDDLDHLINGYKCLHPKQR